MDIYITGSGSLVLSRPIPDAILADAYPYFTAEQSFDGGIFLTLSPYLEVYSEKGIRSFLLSLRPYVKSGRVDCSLRIMTNAGPLYPDIRWAYHFIGGHLSRHVYGTGSCTAIERIDC